MGTLPRSLLLIALVAAGSPCARADDAILPATITFATSTGYWEDPADAGTATPAVRPRHGYYKLFSVRQPDRTARIFLQRVAQDEAGPLLLSTTELSEFSGMKAYVTDIRGENATGIIREPGLSATVTLRTDPDADPEPWMVMIDEFGDVTVEKPGN